MARRPLRRPSKPKVKRRYILLPKEQHRPAVPVGNSVFRGAEIVETEEDLEHWVGILVAHAPGGSEPEVPESKPEPAPAPKPVVEPKPSETPTVAAPVEPAPVDDEPKADAPKVSKKKTSKRRSRKAKTEGE